MESDDPGGQCRIFPKSRRHRSFGFFYFPKLFFLRQRPLELFFTLTRR
jgi:hypothetical protein